jgi:hypothetical protein
MAIDHSFFIVEFIFLAVRNGGRQAEGESCQKSGMFVKALTLIPDSGWKREKLT